MGSVSISRRFDASPETLRSAIRDVEPFMRAAGFDEVERDGDSLHLVNRLGIATMELDLELLDREPVLAYRQREGIFEEMYTEYRVESADDGSDVTARTEFELGFGPVGSVLDATVIERQRRREVEAQFDYLEETAC